MIIRDIEGEEEIEASSRSIFNALRKRFASSLFTEAAGSLP
jgi:hypothetical protein